MLLIENSSKNLEEGIMIINACGMVGKYALVGWPMSMSQLRYGIKGVDNIDDYPTYYVISSQIADLQESGHGSVLNPITRSTFGSIKIANRSVKPSISADDHVDSHSKHILGARYQNIMLSKFRDALLPKLLSSELEMGAAAGNHEEVD